MSDHGLICTVCFIPMSGSRVQNPGDASRRYGETDEELRQRLRSVTWIAPKHRYMRPHGVNATIGRATVELEFTDDHGGDLSSWWCNGSGMALRKAPRPRLLPPAESSEQFKRVAEFGERVSEMIATINRFDQRYYDDDDHWPICLAFCVAYPLIVHTATSVMNPNPGFALVGATLDAVFRDVYETIMTYLDTMDLEISAYATRVSRRIQEESPRTLMELVRNGGMYPKH